MTSVSVSVKKFTDTKNTGQGDEFVIELTSLDLNQAYPLDYSEYMYLLTISELYPS